MKSIIVAGVVSSVIVGTSAWSHAIMGRMSSSSQRVRSGDVRMMAWTGDRRPAQNPLREECKMGAGYDREALRTRDYIDYDQQNPPLDTQWWEAYYPSEEEQQAAAEGYDFAHPEAWLEAKQAGTLVINKNEPTEFVAKESFTVMSREWPELKKELVAH